MLQSDCVQIKQIFPINERKMAPGIFLFLELQQVLHEASGIDFRLGEMG